MADKCNRCDGTGRVYYIIDRIAHWASCYFCWGTGVNRF